ncbi:MAG: hypothetical protein CVV33_03865 [Methanomicrobiales archaeon HGW-Methanomicrobiales-4]|nr:MAG: hypothetical protein CVV33_03865 [Methanomicrobiales archaeon HGW-Methanomicrobiales-4]
MMTGTSLTLADSKIPDLSGNWTGTSTGHDRAGGFDGPSSWQFLLSVGEQKNRAFNGTISYTNILDKDKTGVIGFSGVIGPDMKTVYLTEYTTPGFIIGQIMDPDTMELIYLESGEDASAAIDTFTREKRS